jgi:hypothetical protein
MVAGACFEATKTEVVCFSGDTVRQGDTLDVHAVPDACSRGHPLTAESMYTDDREGRWRCRQCGRERAAVFRARQKRRLRLLCIVMRIASS